ncbi:hypothetical protein VTO73DRAFT_13997 [Trametes versicolor]
MPRFLDTRTGEFFWVEDPSTIIYAVLSHTWRSKEEGGEQTYRQVEKLRKRIQKARTSVQLDANSILSHPDLSKKIKGICEVARKAGYKYIWIDSCCIDKTSSAELAEAINSMFDLYRFSAVCYVYLSDVPDGTRTQDKDSSFAKSRWHTRGWTLQELIAPDRVVFLSSQWTSLGTKIGLAATLHNITGIDIGLLAGRSSLHSFSVARRMSWAARRETTRVEDEAYSLLGIFGVHMSPIYGEGRNAFLRLQEEIIKNIPDQSIFAWGSSIALASLDGPPESHRYNSASMEPTGLLAPSPSAFSDTGDVEPLSARDFVSRLTECGIPGVVAPSLHCMFTPQGVRLDILCIDLAEMPEISHFAIQYIMDPLESLPSYTDHIAGHTRSWFKLDVDRTEQVASWHSLYSIQRPAPASSRAYPSPPIPDAAAPPYGIVTSCHATPSRYPSFATQAWAALLRDLHSTSSVFEVQLGPTCEEDLHILGFQVLSPPTVVRSLLPERFFVETALSSPLLEGESHSQFRQHIRIKLVVHSSWVGVDNLELQFEPPEVRHSTRIAFEVVPSPISHTSSDSSTDSVVKVLSPAQTIRHTLTQAFFPTLWRFA